MHNTHNYALDRILSSHTAGVSQVAFSADSTLLASASDDRTVRVWSVDPASDDDPAAPDVEGPGPHETSKRLLRGHLSAVFCVAWHPLGALLASGGMDETVRLWDIQSGSSLSFDTQSSPADQMIAGKCTKVLPAHSDPVSAVGFNQDGSTIVTCSWDSHMCVTTSLTQRSSSCLSSQPDVGHVDWSMSQDACRRRQRTNVSLTISVFFHADKVDSEDPLHASLPILVTSLSRRLVATLPFGYGTISTTSSSRLSQVTSIESESCFLPLVCSLTRIDRYCIPMFATPDGKHVVTGSEDNQVYIWDLQTMRIVKRFESHKGNSYICY